MKKIVIGLTGGLASGKSTVAAKLKKYRRIDLIDSDTISRNLMCAGSGIWKRTVRAFGSEITLSGGEIDRKRLAKIIFRDKAKRKLLESLTHPAIIREIRNKIKSSKKYIIFVDAPLLFEAGLDKFMDKTVAVWVPEKMQIKRLMKRDQINKRDALLRIRAQWPMDKKRKLSDYCIDNSKSIKYSREQAGRIVKDLTIISKIV